MDKPPAYVSAWQLEKSVAAWEELQAKLNDDPAFGADENAVAEPPPHPHVLPPPHELLARLIDNAIWAERREEEAANLEKRMAARKHRYEERGVKIRATITELLAVLNIAAWEGELGAVNMVKGATSVIADIGKLDDAYIRTTITRAPDKVLLGKLLKDGKIIEGAELSNPGYVPRITPY